MNTSFLPPTERAAHDERVRRVLASFRAIPAGAPVRLAKKTSNLFRARQPSSAPGLDVTGFDTVLHVDVEHRTAQVGGMTTYENLLAATLPYGLAPMVVPQLRTITLGGAVTGLGIESTSFRNGLPHESVLEAEVLTGAGEVVIARADNEHAELFAALPNSYGTFGYCLRLQIELMPVRPFVSLRHVRVDGVEGAAELIEQVCAAGEHEGVAVDFCDGTAFSPDEVYLTLGQMVETADRPPSDYSGNQIYYRSIAERGSDLLSIGDYYWRWDTDWFWCSGAFGVQNRWLRPLLPKKYLRSDTYWKIIALEQRYRVVQRIEDRRGLDPRERVIQDVEVPLNRLAEFVRWFDAELGMQPVWLCPLVSRDPSQTWPLYEMTAGEPWVNIGFWGTVRVPRDAPEGHLNRLIEDAVERLGGRKSLYSSAYYDRERFWRLYNGPAYTKVKDHYDPHGRLLDLYDKAVRAR